MSPLITSRSDPAACERRKQILDAALASFARRGFHQTSMQDIGDEAKISVGLIYRYFQNKDAVIAEMAAEHKREIQNVLIRARQAPSLLDALEILFTTHCCEKSSRIESGFVVDLFAEAGRNPYVAELVRDVRDTVMNGLIELIKRSPEASRRAPGLSPRQLAELIFATNHGMLMQDALDHSQTDAGTRRKHQLTVVRRLWRLLFDAPAAAA